MYELNLPEYPFKIKKEKEKLFIFDSQRLRYVTLTPEEWVRQHFIWFLILKLGYPAALLAVECQIKVNGIKKRCDVILYDIYGSPSIIIELKSPSVVLNQSVFDQVAIYNSKLKVKYFIVSNGIQHYFCEVDTENARYNITEEIPTYKEFMILINQ